MLDCLLHLPPAARDAAYDNTRAVATSAAQLAALEARSAALVADHPQALLDAPYGVSERECYDFFASGQPGAATLLFIHGGYWQMRHKNTFRAVVAGALQQGLHGALIGYTLAPSASLTQIVAQVLQGIAAVRRQALALGGSGDIVLCGWSAGGHLTALGLNAPGVVAGLGISGIYDLAPLQHNYLNVALQLRPSEVQALSPLRLEVVAKPLVIGYGTAELPQLQAQSQVFAQHRQAVPQDVIAVADADHFSILQALERADGVLLQRLLAVAGLATAPHVRSQACAC